MIPDLNVNPMYIKNLRITFLHMRNPCPRLDPASGVCGFALDLAASINSRNTAHLSALASNLFPPIKKENLATLLPLILKWFRSEF